ncbi:protein lethal(2)denticleless [Condylostylus longicornis]|uniref:protein lethal(2)denticleless n=1 Tax=Condylostylus longicornis TaxID=2530218 RepID=UPI00244DEE1D|nr:protein lethal(2)denticleless [Condylostylus longicornis]
MNSVIAFFERLQGIRNSFNYDFALTRLCVSKEDSWRGITPSNYSLDYNPEPPIFSAKFANCKNYRHILAIANEDGKIALQDTNKKNFEYEEKALEGQQCHFNAVFDLEWAPGEMKFVSASGDHTARLWEVTEAGIVQCRTFTGHTRSVKTAAFRKNDPAVFSTGGRDGAILIWDRRAVSNVDLGTSRADNCIYSGHGPGTPVSSRRRIVRTPKLSPSTITSSITGLVFQDDNTLVSCGAGDGVIKIWDLRRNYSCFKREPLPKHSLPYAGTSTFKGFTNLLCDDPGNRLYANCMDNTIYCYNLSSYSSKPIEKYVGFRNGTFYIKSCLSPDGQYLISGSSDEKAYIWNINNPTPLLSLNGHMVEVTCVAWSSSYDMPIVTCSDDARHKIWRIGPEKIQDDEKVNYKGHAEFLTEYKYGVSKSRNTSNSNLKTRLQSLDSTPRSLKRIVEENERTPTTIEKISSKRSYSDMNGESYTTEDLIGSQQKRPHIETRGRRLFSPCSSTYSTNVESLKLNLFTISEFVSEDQICQSKLSPVIEHADDNNQENSMLHPNVAATSGIQTVTQNLCQKLSPLSERADLNTSPTGSPLSRNYNLQQTSMMFSPTSNLPNYVLDGQAPHLGIMSPKRKAKEKIDWLTKLRKQKLMTSRTFTLNDKLASTSKDSLQMATKSLNCDIISKASSKFIQDNISDFPSSPKSPNLCGTPKRRISRSGSSSGENILSHSRTPTSNRRNSETTILKFFSTISHSSSSPSLSSIEHQDSEIKNSTSVVVSSCN